MYKNIEDVLGSIGNPELIRGFIHSPIYTYLKEYCKIKKDTSLAILLSPDTPAEHSHYLRGEVHSETHILKLLESMWEIIYPSSPLPVAPVVEKPLTDEERIELGMRPEAMSRPIKLPDFDKVRD